MRQGLRIGYLLVIAIAVVLLILFITSIYFGERSFDFLEIISLTFSLVTIFLSVSILNNIEKSKEKIKLFLSINLIVLALMIILILGIELPGITTESRGVFAFIMIQLPNTIVLGTNLLMLKFIK